MTRVSTHTPRSLEGKSRQHAAGIDSLSKRPGFEPGGGVAVYEIKVFEDVNVVLAGDGAFWWPIPKDLNEAEIVLVEAGVSVASSSGSVEVDIMHFAGSPAGSSNGILTTKISIEPNEYNSKDSASQPVIASGGAYAVAHGDWLRIDVDAAGSGAQGLAVMVGLTPSPLGSVTIQGAKGDPGGVTAWTGQWATSTGYAEGEAVSHNGSAYVAVQGHTSGAASEPGVGVDWEDFWMPLVETELHSSIVYAIDGFGGQLVPGPQPAIRVPYDCTIESVTLLADRIGSVVIDIWKDSYANYPPTDADSITGASPPTITTAVKSEDTTLSGWTTSLLAGDTLIFNVDSVSLIRQLSVILTVRKE